MKVKKLIEMLQALPPNAEVLLWNGAARDVVPIHSRVTTQSLVKPSPCAFAMTTGACDAVSLDAASIKYRRARWEINDFVLPEDIQSGLYVTKTVFVIQAAFTGRKASDRYQSFSY